MSRKLKLVKTTEKDRETLKTRYDLDYREFEGLLYTEQNPPTEGKCYWIYPEANEFVDFGYLRTSLVQSIEESEGRMVVVTMNTVYFFEVIDNEG